MNLPKRRKMRYNKEKYQQTHMTPEAPRENPLNGIRDQLKELKRTIEAGKQTLNDAPDDTKEETELAFGTTVRVICETTAQDAKAAKEMLDAFAEKNPGATLTDEKFKKDKAKLDAILGLAYEKIDGNALILGLSEGKYDLSKLQELDPTELDDEIALLGADMAWTDRAKEHFIETADRVGVNLFGMTSKEMWNFIAGFLATYLEGNEYTRAFGWSTNLKRDIAQEEARKMGVPDDVINEVTKAWEPQHRAWVKKKIAEAGEEPDLLKMITEKQNGPVTPAAPEGQPNAPDENFANEYKEHMNKALENIGYTATVNIVPTDQASVVIDSNGDHILNVPIGEKTQDGQVITSLVGQELLDLMGEFSPRVLDQKIVKVIPGEPLHLKKIDADTVEVRAKMNTLGEHSSSFAEAFMRAGTSQKAQEVRMPVAGEHGFGAPTPFAKIENGVLLVNRASLENLEAAEKLAAAVDGGGEQTKALEWIENEWKVTPQS